MRLTKEDKDVLIYSALLVITVIVFALTFQIRNRGTSIAESPRLLPFITEGGMFLLSVAGIVSSLRKKGRPTPAKIKGSLIATVKSPVVHQTVIAMAIVTVYVLVGLRFLGFYISSALLIFGVTVGYVRSLKFYWAIPIALALTGALYLIFYVAFNLRLT